MANSTFSAQTDFRQPSRIQNLDAHETEDRDLIDLGAFGGFAELLDGQTTPSGTRVTHQAAMRMPAFWQGVTLISGDVAKVPLEVYRQDDDHRAVEPSHFAHSIVRWIANPDQSAFEWRRQMMVHALVWGNAYSIIKRNGRGEVTALYPLLPDRTNCKVVNGEKIYQSEINGKKVYFKSYDIWHLKGISFDGNQGLDLVSYAKDEIGKILARTKFASKFFKHGGRLGGILEIPSSKNKKSVDKIESGFRKTYEGDDAAFLTVILRENAKFHAAQSTFKDSQMVEVGIEDSRVVARLLNIPPHKLGVPGTSSHNSLEQENKSYYNSCLSHWFCGIESECWMKLLPRAQRKNGRFSFDHTISALLWAESKTVAEIGSKGVMSGWLRPNEPRKWFNLPKDPDGDRLLIPSGMTYAGQPDVDPEPGDDENGDKRSLTDAINKLIRATERRFLKRLSVQARKAAKNESTFDAWLDADLESQLPHGRTMFEDLGDVELAATGQQPDHAERILKRFRGNLAAARNAGENILETIGDLSA